MTRDDLEEKLLAAVAELAEARRRLEPLAKEWAIADTEYRKRHAIAFWGELGPQGDKKAKADKETAREMLRAHELKAVCDAAKENVRALEVEISAYQTLAGLMKSDMAMAGRYET